MNARAFVLLVFCLNAYALSQSSACSQYNASFGPVLYANSGTAQHSTGSHMWGNTVSGNCTYSGSGWGVPCSVTSVSSSTSHGGESGVTIPYLHSEAINDAQGNSSAANGGAATSNARGAVDVHSCLVVPCSVSISFTGNGSGVGWTVQASGSGPPAAGCSWVFDTEECTYYQSCGDCTSTCSPLIVDTTGKGFQLTDPRKNCVIFNLTGKGLGCYSWPVPGTGNGWLVYDDGSGVIESGAQLFGDFTTHAAGIYGNSPNPNGFLALGWYDLPAQGGNMNSIIDKRDKVWTKLKVWIDDHCYKDPDAPCQSLPSELHSLDEFGIHSISLDYGIEHRYTDQYGNNFRFSAVINPDSETKGPTSASCPSCDLRQQSSSDSRLIFDVYVATGAPADGSGVSNVIGGVQHPRPPEWNVSLNNKLR